MHQAYIEPHACVVSYGADGQCLVWSSSQGQFMVRSYCAKLLGIELSNIRVMPAEIGGGFGGKTLVYLEPLALALSKKSGRAGEDGDDARRGVPRHRPDLGRHRRGEDRRDARTARSPPREAMLKYQAGAFAGSPVQPGCMTAFAVYDLKNVRVTGYDVVSNRRRSPPIARPARRSPASASRARWTNSRASWAWTRSSCA